MMLIAAWTTVAVAAAILIGAHTYYWIDARDSRRDSSRFPLFAVRDDLVFLIASKKMLESDPAWKILYQTVNHLLDISCNTTMFSMVFRNARIATRVQASGEAADLFRRIQGILETGARQVPEFANALIQMDAAMLSMTRERTPRWQWWILKGLVVVMLPVILVRRSARNLAFHPSAASAAVLAQRKAHPGMATA